METSLRPPRQIVAATARALCAALPAAWLAATLASPAAASSRIKDITDFEGVRDNPLVGYGLVVGLNGTGDSLRNSAFTAESLQAMLERLGVSTRGAGSQDQERRGGDGHRHAAAVRPPGLAPRRLGQRAGRRQVARRRHAAGDAALRRRRRDLRGQPGPARRSAASSPKARPRASPGASRPPPGSPPAGSSSARSSSSSTSSSASGSRCATPTSPPPSGSPARSIAASMPRIAQVTDPTTVALSVPPLFRGRAAALLTDIEQLAVEPDQPARVLIDERSGIIVMGDDVRISRVAVAQGNLTVRVTELPQVSQPNPLAEGDTVVVPRSRVEVDDDAGRSMVVLQEGVSLQELVAGLNALGVGPRDLISILQAIKAAGALAGRDRGDVMSRSAPGPDRRARRPRDRSRHARPARCAAGRGAGVRGDLPRPGAGPPQSGARRRRSGRRAAVTACFTRCSTRRWPS